MSDFKNFIVLVVLSVLMALMAKAGYGVYLGCLFALALILWGGVMLYAADSFGKALEPSVKISRYREVLRYVNELWGRNYPTLIAHFPADIFTDARDVLFYHQHFLKGGGTIQLRMKLFPERIEEIQARFRLTAKLKYIPGSKDNSIQEECSRKGMMVLSQYTFLTSRVSDRLFPEILVLDDTSVGYDYLKRGYTYGVSIDSSTSEVIYWAMVHSD